MCNDCVLDNGINRCTACTTLHVPKMFYLIISQIKLIRLKSGSKPWSHNSGALLLAIETFVYLLSCK